MRCKIHLGLGRPWFPSSLRSAFRSGATGILRSWGPSSKDRGCDSGCVSVLRFVSFHDGLWWNMDETLDVDWEWLGMIGMLVIHRRNLQHQTAEMLIRALWCKPNREDRQKAGLLTGAAPYTCRQHQHSSSFHPMTRLTANGSPTRDVTPCLSCLIWRDSLLFAQCYLLANCLAPGPNTSETWSPPLLTIGEYKLEEDIISADPGRRKGERARE